MVVMNKKILLFGIVILLFASFVNSAITPSEVLMYWSFDDDNRTADNSTVYDWKGTYDGTVEGANVQVAFNSSGVLGGRGVYISDPNQDGGGQSTGMITNGVLLDNPPSDVSISVWVKFGTNPDFGVNNFIFAKTNDNDEDRWFIDVQNDTGGLRFFTEYNNAGPKQSYSGDISTGDWHHFVWIWGSSEGKQIYLDGNLVADVPGEINIMQVGSDKDFYFGSSESGGDSHYTLHETQLDEFAIFNVTLNSTQILELYNGGSGYNPLAPIVSPASGDFINITEIAPSNATQFNTNRIPINVTVNASSPFNCTLYVNGLVNNSINGTAAGVNINLTSNVTFGANTEDTFSYYWNCRANSSEENSTNATFFVDNVLPNINFNIPKSDNTTIINLNNSVFLNTNITIEDPNLYSYRYNITYGNGTVLFNYSNTSLTGLGNYTINNTINMTGQGGIFYAVAEICDGHTSNDLKKLKNPIKNEYKLDFDDVKIYLKYSTHGKSTEYTKLKDRYSFDFNTKYKTTKETFIVEGKNYVDILDGKTEFKGHLVLDNMYWVDFENPNVKNIIIKRVSQTVVEVEVTFFTSTSTFSFNSIGELNCVTDSKYFYVYDIVEDFTTPLLTTQSSLFSLNITGYNSSYLGTPTAKFFYNNTQYNITGHLVDDIFTFNKTITSPFVTAQTNITFNWNYTLLSINYTTAEKNQTINPLIIDDCTTGDRVIYNYTVYDEETKTNDDLVDVLIETDINISNNQYSWVYNGSINGSGSVSLTLCVDNSSFNVANLTVNSITRYKAENHTVEFYYHQNASLSTATNPIINLYTLNTNTLLDEYSTSFLINYQDVNYLNVEEAVIDLQRLYVSEGQYISVEHAMTDDSGNTRLHFVTEDVKYKVTVRKNNRVLYQSSSFLAICQDTPCQINFQERDEFQDIWDYSDTGNLNWAIDVNDTSRKAIASFSTVDGSTVTANLQVIEWTARLNTTICNTNLTTSSGSIECTIPTTAKNTTYYVQFGTYNSPFTFKEFILWTIEPIKPQSFSYSGLILTVLLTLVMVYMSIQSGMIAVIFFAILGLLVSGMLLIFTGGSIFAVGSSIIWLIVAGSILIWKKTQK